MRSSAKLLWLISIVFVLVVAGILLMDRWVGQELRTLEEQDPVTQHAKAPVVRQVRKPAAQPVRIDPDNDPLAPVVVRKTDQEARSPRIKRPAPKATYDIPLKSPVLLQ